MAGNTYKTRGIVLRKNKLAEKDLIVSILAEDGSLARAVAKGARKPGGSLAARLELFSVVDLVLARGRNLDVVTGAVFAPDVEPARYGVEQSCCASVLAELLFTLAQEDLPHGRLFECAQTAFARIGRAQPRESLAVMAAALLKALALAGFRPRFDSCALCGEALVLEGERAQVAFSIEEGGAVCGTCARPVDLLWFDRTTLQWAHALMMSRFDDVEGFDVDPNTLFEVLQIVRQWTRVHVGKNLKSLDYLFACGLF